MVITEENFIEEIKNGNEDGLYYVVDNYLYILKAMTNKHLFYLEDRKEECINDCLLAIWENIDSYDPERSDFKNWVAGIGKYKSIDYIRKYLDEREVGNIEDEIIEDEEDGLNTILEEEYKEQIDELLSNLSDEDKIIFKETYFNERSASEISQEIGLKESVIYNRLSRGREKLRVFMGGRKQ